MLLHWRWPCLDRLALLPDGEEVDAHQTTDVCPQVDEVLWDDAERAAVDSEASKGARQLPGEAIAALHLPTSVWLAHEWKLLDAALSTRRQGNFARFVDGLVPELDAVTSVVGTVVHDGRVEETHRDGGGG